MEVKLLFVIVVALVAIDHSDSNEIILDGCRGECYGVEVPYPFGIGNSNVGTPCFLEKSFELTCNNTISSLTLGNIPVISINIYQGQADMLSYVSKYCYNSSGVSSTTTDITLTSIRSFTISSKDNKFISVGCNTYGYLNSFYNNTEGYSTGCLTRCYGNNMEIHDGYCSGIGCCEVDIPPRMREISTIAGTFDFENFTGPLDFNNNCSYSFVVKNGNYTFSKEHLVNLPFDTSTVVFDWSVGNETCEESRSKGTITCKGNSTCVDADTGYGYRCQCKKGFEGNPYLHGCTDIDECKTGQNSCVSDHNCHNTNGSYICFCPKGQSGNGTKEDGCHKKNVLPHIFIGASAGFIAILVGTCLLYLTYQKRKFFKLKQKFFEQNGGLILLQKGKESSHTKIFTANKLKKATNNYDEKLIIGRGGYGTVFKGVLENDTVVAIKKSKIVDAGQLQVEQFINEVIVLSQINHRNVVKLLGCCLETEVPLLVYEFVSNGIHNENKRNNFNWENRLRIATEAAEALSYLHSSASIPIVHRDVKSANILLDEDYTAKVSDFGASRFVPVDQNALATMVQGTIGYLDPEYMQTNQLTEKSDVYSFGVVLAELLTGKKPFSFVKLEENTNLATYFLSCLKEDCLFEALQVGILNEGNKQEIVEVAIVAAKCLRLKGEERPSMKEVAIELEGIRLMSKCHWVNNGDKNFEEIQHLLPMSSSSEKYEHGDSSSGSHQNTKYDSIIKDQEVLIALPSGR
ncbi:wall-associated receptor kinase 2-like [Arachis stenosperma]|uniref:wall-associated receptor kinase 2-like n=1 Tax=Arachis stenosperma TaxID=217475 RepID=UPI0025AC7BE2|nr:wall-associated receptor kinase 2-like [Arachis stenosperma]